MANDNKKDCKKCQQLRSMKSYQKGSKVRIIDTENCATCIVTLSQPLPCNEPIIELYESIPCYDSWSGMKSFTTTDILNIFRIYSISKNLWEEYYNKLIFFHNQIQIAKAEQTKKEQENQKEKSNPKVNELDNIRKNISQQQLRQNAGVKK